MDHQLVHQVISRIASHLTEAKEVVQRLAEQDLTEAHFRRPEATALPVLRYLPECLRNAHSIDATLAADLEALAPHLNWRQTAAYTDAVLGEGFTANYGWSQLIGPRGCFRGEDFLLGLFMLGPGQFYRDHFHPAPELYWPLTSGTFWRAAPSGFVERPAGTLIWHEPNQIHAMRTEARPLLALWAWTRDTATSARLVD